MFRMELGPPGALPGKAMQAPGSRKNSSKGSSASQASEEVSPSPPAEQPAQQPGIAEDIALCRRVVPVIETSDDCCPICLDEYTQEDPGNKTACGHHFHLQCVMQWAQRSRECPLCFKPLQLADTSLNELLPFGEYVAPERLSPNGPCVLMGLDAWELERLLQRLAANGPGGPGARRERRSRTRTALLTTQVPSASERMSMGAHASSSAANGDEHHFTPELHVSSWPPHSSEHGRRSDDASSSQASQAPDLRSRWAAVSNRCRESLQKTTRELKGRWSMGRDRALSPSTPRGRLDQNGDNGAASRPS